MGLCWGSFGNHFKLGARNLEGLCGEIGSLIIGNYTWVARENCDTGIYLDIRNIHVRCDFG